MAPLLTTLTALRALLFTTIVSSSILPDCGCITGWNSTELDCDRAVTDGTIELLQDFLSLNSMNCLSMECDINVQCQQSLSLLSQYYDYCPLGIIDDQIIRDFWQHSSCTDCKQVPLHHTHTNRECLTNIDCSPAQVSLIEDEINGFILNCIDNTNESLLIDCDSNECDNYLYNITSFMRQCRTNIANDNTLFNDLFAMLNSYKTNEQNCDNAFDCNIIQIYDHSGYKMECDSNTTDVYKNINKLDLLSLQRETMFCFYGLNIANPTDYDLICIDKDELNMTGILSYEISSNATNTEYFSMFGVAADMDMLWVLLCGAFVFFMQTGFTLLEAGTVKAGNVQNILFKNMMDACIGSVVFYIIGYCVAYGNPLSDNANGFIGVGDILIESQDYISWFFQWAFAATAATIVSGAVAERCSIEAYFIYTIVISSWIYPIIVHWVWSENGWLSPFNTNPAVYGGAIDFAGSAVVHMVGGFCGLMGAYWLGPRLRRFDNSEASTNSQYYKELMHQFEFGHNVPFQVFGTLILWFGWYGFNCGSTLAANGAMELASKVAVNTTLAAASGGITTCLLAKLIQKKWHIPRVCNGVLAALVSITASCSVVSPGVSIVIGIVGGLIYYGASNLMEKIEIDDPLDAFAVHGCGGMWGILSAGIFGTDANVKFSLYSSALYKDTSHGQRFATQIVLVLAVAGWTIVNSGILFGVLKWGGILRVEESYERSGIDLHEHGGSAVNMKPSYEQINDEENSKDAKEKMKDNKEIIDNDRSMTMN